MNEKLKEIIVCFEKIGHNGISIGRYNHKVVFAYGILPGETAKIRILKEKKDFIEGELIEILEKSPYRIEPKEDHYLSCSPWQTFDYNMQIELKKEILKEIFLDFANEEINLTDFLKAEKIWEYRTKIEYSFMYEADNRRQNADESRQNADYYEVDYCETNENKVQTNSNCPIEELSSLTPQKSILFAFYKRGSSSEKVALKNGCLLFDQKANKIALDLLEEINKRNLCNLKSLIIRRSTRLPFLHFSLFVMEKNIDFSFSDKNLTGFSLIYSDPKSPASVYTEILKNEGREEIIEKIGDLTIKYHYSSFFQNNIELFEKALNLMDENLDEVNKVVDLYCGVGVIGLYLAKKAKKVIGVDIDQKAIEFAKINAEENAIRNFKGIALPSEKIDSEILKNTDLLILDPPRSGLHKNVIKLILASKPKKIFYLSCNPITQARDYSLIKEYYQIEKIYGFDFYPQTNHLESLLILQYREV